MDNEDTPPHDAALMTFELLVCTIGFFGNGLVIFVVLILQEYKKTVTNWYVLQLAIADALFLLTIPFKVVEDWNNEWIFHGGVCKAKEAVLYINYYSSILFLMIMSIDRYIAVCHPLSSMQKFRNYRECYIITACIWAISILLSIPIWLYSDKRGQEPYCTCSYEFPSDISFEEECRDLIFMDLEQCVNLKKNAPSCVASISNAANFSGDYSDATEITDFENNSSFPSQQTYQEDYGYYNDNDTFGTYNFTPTSVDSSVEGSTFGQSGLYNLSCTFETQSKGFKAFLLFNFIALFLIPLLVMSVCYTLIGVSMQKFRSRSETLHSSNNQSSRKMSKSEKDKVRVTVICAILVVLFVICWLPYHFTLILKLRGISGTDYYCNKLASIFSLLNYVNSALNPYVYNCIGTKFFHRCRRALQSIGIGRRVQTESTSSGTGKQYKRNETKLTGYSSTQEKSDDDQKTKLTVTYKPSDETMEMSHRR